jgi:hypothetical protein
MRVRKWLISYFYIFSSLSLAVGKAIPVKFVLKIMLPSHMCNEALLYHVLPELDSFPKVLSML